MKKTVVSTMAENGAPLKLITWYFELFFLRILNVLNPTIVIPKNAPFVLQIQSYIGTTCFGDTCATLGDLNTNI
jgi:hypothetical protein